MSDKVYYWDTSAVLSALLQDVHSEEAAARLARKSAHLVSSLTGAEFHACIARLVREGQLTPELADATVQAYEQGPWRRITREPDPDLFGPLSRQCRLRGADLWHLAMAVSLRHDLPELSILTFDAMLLSAAQALGLGEAPE